MRYQVSVFISIATAFVFLLMPALFVYYIDPYQIFHRTTFANVNTLPNQRYQNAGLINSYLADPKENYDSIMVGTSLSDNFTVDAAQKSLHWRRPLRLNMDGSKPKEQAELVRHALSKPNVKHVLWELFPRFYWPQTNDYSIDVQIFPEYLYNDNRIDNYPYLFNFDILKDSWHIWSGYLFLLSPDKLGYWGDNPSVIEQHRNFNSPENILAMSQHTKLELQSYKEPVSQWRYPVLEDEVFTITQKYCNTDVEFIFFVPPVSKIDYLAGGEYAVRTVSMARFILYKISNCSNLHLYAFDLFPFANDLNNYKDQEHYLPDISIQILELIGKKQGLLTLNNIDAYESGFIDILNKYQIRSSFQSTY